MPGEQFIFYENYAEDFYRESWCSNYFIPPPRQLRTVQELPSRKEVSLNFLVQFQILPVTMCLLSVVCPLVEVEYGKYPKSVFLYLCFCMIFRFTIVAFQDRG
jgi:hypothetical protein